MRLLLLAPPRKPKHLVSNLQSLDIRAYFNNRSGRAIPKDLRMLDQQPAVVLVQVQRRGSRPFNSYTNLIAFGFDRGNLFDTKRFLDANSNNSCVGRHGRWCEIEVNCVFQV
jgi:hypothetical protein